MNELLEGVFGRPSVGPLAGLVVADLSRVLAGPYATMLLADMGALVIKVESVNGDDTRTWSPPHRENESTYFLSVNRNKFSIALDFNDPSDRAILNSIIDRSDVLIENFRPGTLEHFGLDAKSVQTDHPSLIYASITGFGSGKGAEMPGYDLLVQALSGFMDITGDIDGEPQKAGVALFDVVTGLHTALGVLAALHERGRTGVGDRIQANLLSSALSGLVNQSGAFVAGREIPRRMGNEHPSLYPYEPFPTRDKKLVIAVGNDGQFRKLCECLGVPEIAVDERFATMPARNSNREQLRPLLIAELSKRGAMDWFERLKSAGVPSAPILKIDEGLAFAKSVGLDPTVITGYGDRLIPAVRHPLSFDRSTVDYSQAPPKLDADRARVLEWIRKTARPRTHGDTESDVALRV